MQLWLLSCHIVLPPLVWTLFVRAPSGLDVFTVCLVLPCSILPTLMIMMLIVGDVGDVEDTSVVDDDGGDADDVGQADDGHVDDVERGRA